MSDLILEIVEGPGAGKQVPLDGVLDVGRDTSLPLHFDQDGQVSRRHARFAAQAGNVVVEDLGSTNGTYVNEQPISSPRTLRPGDKVRMGLTVLELRTRQQVAARPSAVQARPALTAIDNDVLLQVPEDQLAPVADVPPAGPKWYEIDCLWRAQRLIVELDGSAAHHTARAFERDREKDRRLRVVRWNPIRVTWLQLHHEEPQLAADLRALLS